MKIVVLNKCFFSKKHLERLRKLGQLALHDDTCTEKEAITRLRGTNVAVANGMICPFTKSVFANAKDLRLLVLNSTGVDFVDLGAAKKHEVRIANLPGYATEAVAEHVFALLFAITRRITVLDKEMREACFQINPANRGNQQFLSTNIKGKTLGILGFGSIGQRAARLGLGIGMKVIVHGRVRRPTPQNIHWVSKKRLVQESDVLSLHLPLSRNTQGIIGRQELRIMKPGAILINTARGGLIDETALYHALKTGRLLGAGLDVLSDISPKNPLLKLPNVVFTPHSAWWTKESLQNQAEMIVQIIEKFSHKKSINFVI